MLFSGVSAAVLAFCLGSAGHVHFFPQGRQQLIEQTVQAVVREAFDRAVAGSLPEEAEALEDIYSSADLDWYGRT